MPIRLSTGSIGLISFISLIGYNQHWSCVGLFLSMARLRFEPQDLRAASMKQIKPVEPMELIPGVDA
jgi:hypothetical protein